ncbi:hypothetical protein C7974DRAFT_474424 [Boeremia exigua]|uniref:uncharacterized protein n=1 Tax=Boeremia exigua TaxID=749465 RepID=UPI001E8EA411|nr:uncharacterized protein C7974DRAFT_474424 [Boeremia exigua]KAH6618605.1 hypothetical protein C7974DRAFT_474424 [Boeremia exigua]
MAFLQPILASNALIESKDVPKIAVFVGATDGIGKATLKALVLKRSPIKIYVVGRNEASHRPMLEDLTKSNPFATIVFLEGQISLVAEAQRLASLIAAQEDSVDLLFMSSGYLPFTGPQATSEGLETSLVVSYYSHIAFTLRLLPQLRRASATKPARVVNILAAGQESTDLLLNDLGLNDPGNFSVPAYARHAATFVTVTLKRIAEDKDNSGIVFIHAHPGVVSTDLFMKSWAGKFDPASPSPMPARNFAKYTPEEAGERSLYLATSAEYGGEGVAVQNGRQSAETVEHGSKGALFCVDDKLVFLQPDTLLNELQGSGAQEAIWKHTVQILEAHAGAE